MTSGESGADERHLYFQLGGLKIDPYTAPKRPAEKVLETITGIARTGTVVGEDNSATTIFD